MANKLYVGDIVFNEWQSKNDHTAYMVVVGISSKTISCISPTAKPGQIRKFERDSRLKLRRIGNFDLSAFLSVVDAFKEGDENEQVQDIEAG